MGQEPLEAVIIRHAWNFCYIDNTELSAPMEPRRVFSFIIVLCEFATLVSEPTYAQTQDSAKSPTFQRSMSYSEQELEGRVPKARPEDVSSPEAIVKALHDSVSGPQGAWNPDRLRSLCVPGVYFVAGDKGEDGVLRIATISLDDAIKDFTQVHEKSGWYESVYKMRVTQAEKDGGYRVATVDYSARAGTKPGTDTKPSVSLGTKTGLLYIGSRWWIVSHMW